MKKLYLLPLLFLLALASCKEENEAPAPQPEVPETPQPDTEPEQKAFTFNFRYDLASKEVGEFELILSQKDGTLLLDTLLTARANHSLTVVSADSAFDFTTIYLDPTVYMDKSTDWYSIQTYVQVNPSNWTINAGINRTAFDKTEPATIHYTNVPPFEHMKFASKQSNQWGYDYADGNLTLTYDRQLPTDLAYLLLPFPGLYIFTDVSSPETYVDFSRAIPTTKINYDKPAGITDVVPILHGYTEAGDYSQPMTLYSANHSYFPAPYDLQYPQTGIEEFELIFGYTDAEGYRHTYVHNGGSVPTQLPFLSKSDFTVIKDGANDFQIEFGEDKPVTYTVRWRSERPAPLNANWSIYLSSGETTFKPLDYLTNLEAQKLEGKDLSGLTLSNISSYTAKGYTHQSMLDYHNIPELYLRKDLRQYREIRKFFF